MIRRGGFVRQHFWLLILVEQFCSTSFIPPIHCCFLHQDIMKFMEKSCSIQPKISTNWHFLVILVPKFPKCYPLAHAWYSSEENLDTSELLTDQNFKDGNYAFVLQ